MATPRFDFDVRADLKEAERYLTDVEKKAVPRAARRALNRTIKQVNTVARRSIAKGVNQKQKDIKHQLKVIPASQQSLSASLRATGNKIPLIDFRSPRQTKKGVKVTVGGKRHLFEGAFIATMNSGHKGIFTRKTRKRLPIREMMGPSVPNWFVRTEINAAMQERATEQWPANFNRDLDYYLRRVA